MVLLYYVEYFGLAYLELMFGLSTPISFFKDVWINK